MRTLATIITGGGDDQHALPFALVECISQELFWLFGEIKLSTADIDYVGGVLEGKQDGSGQVELRTGEFAVVARCKNWE
jgi:hypothetical protein